MNFLFLRLLYKASLVTILFICTSSSLQAESFEWHSYLSEAQNTVEISRRKNSGRGIAIGIGRSCAVAENLKCFHLRDYSFPLDWILTSFDGLVGLFETDFHDFFNYEHFSIGMYGVYHSGYDIYFPHIDLNMDNWELNGMGKIQPKNSEGLTHYHKIKENFCRRVARLYAFLNSNLPIYLIRNGDITVEQGKRLYELLKRKFPTTNLTLICTEEHYSGAENYSENSFHYYPIKVRTPEESANLVGAIRGYLLKVLK